MKTVVSANLFAALRAVDKSGIISQRIPQTGKFRVIGTTGAMLRSMLKHGWIEEVQISQNTLAYILTLKGHQAIIRLEKIKPVRGFRAYEEKD